MLGSLERIERRMKKLDKWLPAPAQTKHAGISQQFKTKYLHDPAGFVNDCIDWERVPNHDGPYEYQLDVLNKMKTNHRTSVRGPHGLGKTTIMAWVVIWFALTRDGTDWKIPTTASAWRQLIKFLWPEIRKWTRYLKWDKIGREPFNLNTELHTRNLRLETGEAFAMASNDETLLEGAHADHLLVIFDESKSIPSATWDAVEGAFSTNSDDLYWLAFSTPGDVQGRFYEIHTRKAGTDDWYVRHVTLEETIKAGAVTKDWAEQRKAQWGENSSLYQNRVLGQFATEAEDVVIPLSWVEAAIERWKVWKDSGENAPKQTSIGVDVARFGADKSVFAVRCDKIITEIKKTAKQDTMKTTGHAILLMRDGSYAVIDTIGVGAGVFDRMSELGYRVIPFNAGAGKNLKDDTGVLSFLNNRAKAWWMMRELLNPNNEENVMLPDDGDLIGDLTAPKWAATSTGKIKVESKDDIRKRIGRSTDCADAVIQAFWGNTSLILFGA